MYPASVFPVWCEVAIAVYLGHAIYKQGKSVMTWSIIAVIVMYLTVFIGVYIPIKMPAVAGIPATGVWTIILLIYAFIASTLPVTTLLQPRDFINSHQLLIAGIPALLMIFMTIWALVLNQTKFGASHNMLLQVVNGITLLLAVWIAIIAVFFDFPRFYAGAIVLMAPYAVYYYFPSEKRICFDRKIFRVK